MLLQQHQQQFNQHMQNSDDMDIGWSSTLIWTTTWCSRTRRRRAQARARRTGARPGNGRSTRLATPTRSSSNNNNSSSSSSSSSTANACLPRRARCPPRRTRPSSRRPSRPPAPLGLTNTGLFNTGVWGADGVAEPRRGADAAHLRRAAPLQLAPTATAAAATERPGGVRLDPPALAAEERERAGLLRADGGVPFAVRGATAAADVHAPSAATADAAAEPPPRRLYLASANARNAGMQNANASTTLGALNSHGAYSYGGVCARARAERHGWDDEGRRARAGEAPRNDVDPAEPAAGERERRGEHDERVEHADDDARAEPERVAHRRVGRERGEEGGKDDDRAFVVVVVVEHERIRVFVLVRPLVLVRLRANNTRNMRPAAHAEAVPVPEAGVHEVVQAGERAQVPPQRTASCLFTPSAELLALSEEGLSEREAERKLRPFCCQVPPCQRRYKNMNGCVSFFSFRLMCGDADDDLL